MYVVVVIRHAEAPPNSTTTQSNWPTAHQFFSRPFMMGLRSCETLVLVDRQSVTAERKPKALDENPPSSSSTAKEFPPVVVLVRRHCHPSSAPPAGSFQEVSLRLENARRKLHGNFRRRQSSLSLQERNFVEAPKSLSICLFFFDDSSLSFPSPSPFVKVTCPTRSRLWASLIPIYMGRSVCSGRAAAAAATFRRTSRGPPHFSLRMSFLALLPSEAQVTGYKVSQDLISTNGLAR